MREHSGQACCFLGFGVRGGLRSRPVGVKSGCLGVADLVAVMIAVGGAGAARRAKASDRGISWRGIPAAAAAVAIAVAVAAVAADVGDDEGASGCC